MSETRALDLARRSILRWLEEEPRRALAACVAEDPLRLAARAATTGDDEGLLLDPSDAMVDAYLALVREPAALRDLPAWLLGPFREVVLACARDASGAGLVDALGRALGLDEQRVERWSAHFRTLGLPERRDVLALLRGGSATFRELYPGRTFDLKRDIAAVQRTFSLFRALLARALE